jgi:hypothetical protein
MSFADVVIFALIAIVIFLVWERFHYRRRVSKIYDSLTELAADLDSRFEIRSHPALRHMFTLDAILDDSEAKIAAVGEWKRGIGEGAEESVEADRDGSSSSGA